MDYIVNGVQLMSGLVPYLVPLEKVRAFVGGKDAQECMKIETLWKREIAEEPGVEGALRRMCMGEAAVATGGGVDGAAFVWALEILCAHFGQKLPNATVAAAEDEWLMRVVDPVFDAWGVGDVVKMKRLVYGKWPVKIPHAEAPRGGVLEAEEVVRGLEGMRRGALPRFDWEVVAVVGEVRGWLEACAGRGGGVGWWGFTTDGAERDGTERNGTERNGTEL